MDDIIVSVIVVTYNQEKFIEKALDSILMQKVNFKYEVLIGNDCSPDDTISILNKYNKYKSFKIYNNKTNKGATKNFYELLKKAKGKYIAFLEGDDYWTDDNKLQKQVDFLESNPGYVAVAHRQNIIDINEKFITTYENWSRNHSKIYTFKDVENGKMFFQINSLVTRNYFKDADVSFIYNIDKLVGDRLIFSFITSFGDVYILKNIMSVYRLFEKKERKKSVFDSTVASLNYYEKVERLLFNNKKINFHNYKNKLIADYYFNSILKKEKLLKKNNKVINSYTTTPIIIVILVQFLKYVSSYISHFLWKLKNTIRGIL